MEFHLNKHRHSVVSPHQLEDDAQMTAKQEIVCHVYDMEFVVGVEPPQRVEHLHFNEGLMMKTVHIIITSSSSSSAKSKTTRIIQLKWVARPDITK